MDTLARLEQHLADIGLSVRGTCRYDFEGARTLEDHHSQVVLIGNIGGGFWPIFKASGFSGEDALDRWTKHVLDPIADDVGARALYPSEKPYAPFQQWAMRAEGLKRSPLGILIHPKYGVWHAYRAAF
ncbi:MAG: ferredoxin, partial [Pseudomonadota bacterium]